MSSTEQIKLEINETETFNITVNESETLEIETTESDSFILTITEGFSITNYIATPPEHYNSTGTSGQWSNDDDYFYICVSPDRWMRISGTKNF